MDTQASANQQKDEEKKKAGLPLITGARPPAMPNLAGAWSQAAARAGFGGGLLATKAGLVAAVMAGLTVAGGMGLSVYRLFGPARADRAGGGYASLFSPRPKEAPLDASAPGGGQASSLDSFKSANAGAVSAGGSADGQGASGGQGQGASGSAQGAAAAGGKAAGADNAANVFGNKAAKLQGGLKIGELGKIGGAGGGGSSSASMAAPHPAAADPKGQLLASLPAAGRAGDLGRRATSSRRLGNSFGAAQSALGDQRAANSSYGAGSTYDGSRNPIAGPGGVGSSGGAPAGTTTGGADSSNPTQAGNAEQFPAPPKPTGQNVTPWQSAINMAVMLIAVASMLLLFGEKLKAMLGGNAGMMAIAAIVALIGAIVMWLGGQISGGAYGQRFQGGMFLLAGGALMAGGAAMMMSANAPQNMQGMMKFVMVLSGAAGLGAAMMSYLSKPRTFDASIFTNGIPPDLGHPHARYVPPSQDALDRFVV